MDIKKTIKDRLWKEHLTSNQTSNKRKKLEVPTKVHQADFQVLSPLHSKDPLYGKPMILSIEG